MADNGNQLVSLLLDAGRAADLLGVSEHHFRRLHRSGFFKQQGCAPIRLGNRVLWRRSDLCRMLAANGEDRQARNLYLIRCGSTRYHKIGVSRNVRRRVRDLQSYNPMALYLLDSAPLRSFDDHERRLHKMYRARLIRNEWFDLDANAVSSIRAVLADLRQRNHKAVRL
jgi:hypothetical protein